MSNFLRGAAGGLFRFRCISPGRGLPLAAIVSALALRAFAVDGNFTNVTATGSISAAGVVDADAGLTFGVQSGGAGATFSYTDDAIPGGTNDTLKFSLNRISASWLWAHATDGTNPTGKAMRLTSAHQLLLFQADGSTAGVTLTPASSQLALGSATLTASGSNLATNGALTVASGITNTNGSFTGGASGLTFNAGGSNQGIAFNTSGTGDLVFGAGGTERMRIKSTGNVGIGLASPAQPLDVLGSVHASVGYLMGPDAGYVYSSSGGGVSVRSGTSSAAAYWTFGGDGVFRALSGGATFGGNVGIGVGSPALPLDVSGVMRTSQGLLVGADLGYFYDSGGGNVSVRAGTGTAAAYWTFGGDGVFRASSGGATFTGNVGIGTTSPASKLHIADANPTLVLENTGARSDVLLRNASSPWNLTQLANQGARSELNAGYELHLLADKNAAPAYSGGVYLESDNSMAEYASTAGNKALLTVRMDADGTPQNLFTIRGDTGNVGIGTSNPVVPLEIARSGNNLRLLKISALPATAGNRYAEMQFGIGGDAIANGAGIRGYFTNYMGDYATDLRLFTSNAANAVVENLVIQGSTGNVGIGTTSPSHKLAVNGTIRAKEVIVDTGWADYVFDENYRLAPLSEVEAHIRAEKHLPGIPSAQEVETHGVGMGDMQAKLLSKVEELTLHLIAQEKRISALEQENQALRAQVAKP